MDFRRFRRGQPSGLLAALLLLATLAGCHGTSSELGRPLSRDLPEVAASDTLRILTRNHPLTYYLYKGTRRGFDFELMQRFAREQGLHLEVVVPPAWTDMLPWLYEGRGDVIASMMTVTSERKRSVDFTRSYKEVRQVLVGTEEDPPPTTLEELNGRRVLVRRGSSYEERLRALQEQGIELIVEFHDEINEVEDPVQWVARGRHPLTVVDNTIAALEQHFYPGLVIGAAISEPQQIAWAVRPNSPELLAALNEFLQEQDRSEFYNVLQKRYFDTPDRFLLHRSHHIRLYQEGQLSRYDDIFRRAGEATGFDWRLLAAQSYHESRFKPRMVSWAGAVGLMQMMPRTARAMGVRNIYDPEENIFAGAHYLKRLWRAYDEVADPEERLRVSLAAYNAGMGHIARARRLAAERGGDPDRWPDIARALSALEDPEVYRRAEYSYVRGRSVRRYVADILHRYEIFTGLVQENPQQGSDDLAWAVD